MTFNGRRAMKIRMIFGAVVTLSLAACGPNGRTSEPADTPPMINKSASVVQKAATPTRELPWYEARPESVKTLKQALAEERTFLSYHYVSDVRVKWPNGNPYWHGHNADPKTCEALKSVGMSCDYNTRTTLTDFLVVNGKNLFPAEGGTNPHYTAKDRENEVKSAAYDGHPPMINNAYIGAAVQNPMLAKAVLRNAALFHNGDLTAEDVRHRWR
jgi:hypothetical protein